jgi:TetR/AcrR family transcriptional regulator
MTDPHATSPEPNGAAPQTPAPEQDAHARTRLLNAAVNVFDRKGYAAASVREIAEQAGVTKPALYYHFGSKEGILVAILHEAAAQLALAVEQSDTRVGTARQRITATCETINRMFAEHVPVARVAHAVFLGPPDLMPPFDVTVFEKTLRSAIERIARDGEVTGELRPGAAADLAMAVMGILEGCNERQLQPNLLPVGADDLRRLLDLLFDGAMNTPRA